MWYKIISITIVVLVLISISIYYNFSRISSASEWNEKGTILDKEGKYEEAIKCYNKALDLDPKCNGFWHNKGLTLYNLKKYEEAVKCFDKALELEPKNEHAKKAKEETLKALDK
jgi:tetratricopeptide (TPR) repeat protein